jgi:alpha-1,2-mannosyltransferase
VLWILACVGIALLCYEIPTLVTAVVQPLWSDPNTLQTDFHYYYQAAQRFAGGGPLYLPSDDVIAGFAYPPPAIVPFMALAKLPLGAAFLFLTLASVAALIIASRMWCVYLRRHGMAIPRSTEIAITVIVLALGPSYMNVMIGQVNALVLVSAVAFIALAGSLPVVAGVCLALGVALKIYPVIMAVFGIRNRVVWPALGWAVVAGSALAIVLLPLVPWSAYEAFFVQVLPTRLDRTAIHITNQSLTAFLERFHYPSELFLNWTGQQAVTVGPVIRIINTSVLGSAVVIVWNRAQQMPRPKAAAGLMALVAINAPLGWGHTYVMVLPLVTLQLLETREAGLVKSVTIFLCVVALMIPAGRQFGFLHALPDAFLNVLYSRYLLATAILLAIPSMSVGRTTESQVSASA